MKNNSSRFMIVRYSQDSRSQELVIDSSPFTIGRSSSCEVMIDEQGISRQHLKVHFDGEKIEVEDLGSSNGSFYRNQKLNKGRRIHLENSAKIKLGIGETYVWFELISKELPELPDNTGHRSNALKPSPSLDEEELASEQKKLLKELSDIEKKVIISRTEADRIIQDALRMKNEVSLHREKAEIEVQKYKETEIERLNQELQSRQDLESHENRKRREDFEQEILAYEKKRLGEIRNFENDLDVMRKLFIKDQENFEVTCKQKLIEIENMKKEAIKQKEIILIEAQEQAYLENQKYLKNVQIQIEEAERKQDEIIHCAKLEAEAIRTSSEAEVKSLLEKAKQTALIIRKTAEDEGQIFRDRKEKDLNIMQVRAEEDAKRIIANAETRRSEIVQQAEVILQEASKEAEERTQQAKRLFSKIESEAEAAKRILLEKFENEMLESKVKLQGELDQTNSQIKNLQQTLAGLENKRERLQVQNADAQHGLDQMNNKINQLNQDHAQKLKMITEFENHIQKYKTDMGSLDSQKSDLLRQVSELQRKNKTAFDEAREKGEKILAEYEQILNEKKNMESQVIDQRRLELAMEFKSEEARIKKTFSEQSKLISKNLVKFLQIYHLENKSFDFKNINDLQLKEFENVFFENLLTETKMDPSQQTSTVGDQVHLSKQTKQWGFLFVGAFMLLLAIPQFLSSPYRNQFSVIDRLNPALGAHRYIASLKSDRDRRYTPEKVHFVFENFRFNVMYGSEFVEKWRSDSFQQKWFKHLQNHFYSKYRISEEVMIQVASKESTLVDSLSKVSKDIHPDFFKISYEKMQKEEIETLDQIEKLINNDQAFADYKKLAFEFYSKHQ